MKTFIAFLVEHVIYEHKEWHQFVKQHGSKILDKMGHGDEYSGLQAEPGHGSPAHMTEYIKKHLGLSDVPKEHGKWILGEIQKGRIENLEDVSSTIIPNLQKFQTTQHIHGANLKNVKGPTELFNLVSKHSQDDRDARFGLTAGTDYHVLGENEHWTVIRPHTEKAACSFGKGTNWCTASESNNVFSRYNEQGPMHIFIPKAPKYKGEKYQFHLPSGQFMDHTDTKIHKEPGRGPNFHERPLPKETDNNPDIEHGKIIDALTSGNKEAATEAVNHPNFGSNDHHIDAAIRSPHKEVVIAGVNHPKFGSVYRHVRAALHSPHKEAAMAAVNHPQFYNSNDDYITAFKSPHSEVAMAALKHPRFGSDYDHFNPAVKSPHKEVAMAAMNHPQFGSHNSHIHSALHSPHKEVAMAAMNHSKFNSTTNRVLGSWHLKGALSSPHEEVAMAAINHPDFGSGSNGYKHINAAVQSRHEEVAMAALNHPNYAIIQRGIGSGHHINGALRSPHKKVAMTAVNHPEFGFDYSHIDTALESPHEEVALAAVNHPNFGSGNYGFAVSQIDDALRSPHPKVVEIATRKWDEQQKTSKT